MDFFVIILLSFAVAELFFYYMKLNNVHLLKMVLITGDFIFCVMVFLSGFIFTEVDGKIIDLIVPDMCVIFLLYSFLNYPKIKKDLMIYQVIQKTGFFIIFWGDYNDIESEQKLEIVHKIKRIYVNHEQYSKKFRYSMFLRDKEEVYLLFAFSSEADFEVFIKNIEGYEIDNMEKSGCGMICEMKIDLFN